MIQDRAIVTMECQQELVCDLSTGVIFNDLEYSLPNPDFKVTPLFQYPRNVTLKYLCPSRL